MDVQARGPDDGEQRGRRGLARLRMIAQLFDRALPIPGTKWRFGLDALFGLAPGLGDMAGALVAVYALHVARDLRAPNAVQLMMLMNIALDALIGSIPLVGDVFDFAFQAQTRSLALLDAWMSLPDRTARRSRRSLVLMPLAILVVFATLTALAVWMLFILIHWLAS